MPDVTLPAILLLLGVAVVLLLVRLDVFTPRSVAAWRRIGAHHHLTDERPLDERLGASVPWLARFFRETSIERLLAIANRRESLNTWLVKTGIYILVAAALLLGLDLWLSIFFHGLPVPPLVCLLLAAGFGLLSYGELRAQAKRRQAAIDNAISQSLSEMAILTFSGQYTVAGGLEFVARCHRDHSLLDLMAEDRWRRLAAEDDAPLALQLRPNQLMSTVTIYQRIGGAYDLQSFRDLATNMRRIAEKGLVAADVLTSLSAATARKLVADMTVKSEQAKPRMAVAIGLMVLPLLLLILYPAGVSIGSAFK